MRDKSLVVRRMTEADLVRALESAAAEGWNPGLHDAHYFMPPIRKGSLSASSMALRLVASRLFATARALDSWAPTSSRRSIAGAASALSFGMQLWTIWEVG
jgi:hypothetical protein